ncbi:AGE family epimerase/isomerase [Komagataeibacter medellinensis]|uniref:Mannose-6-phosphate isomerase n=1 Tax=Komagataeibacter medellinensis (strain NBRC 3288 / BCRC 11682 / LMG 1693 / Kondo 51) TaxID=634177 RepID=G2I031_KOMMN|nr:AGE family epimerase/isomerase [Komagataeibacter medellinensis]BAK84289.1 mannose-6-phosphate isomerase [Komagataeibacter medellinensis NBRC 3288]
METRFNIIKKEANHWFLTYAIPMWSNKDRTSSGMFAERIGIDGNPNNEYYRTFVQARHIYSFIVAGQLGWIGPWRSLVTEGIHRLITDFKRQDGFYVHRLDSNAVVLDSRADLYDQAFVLFTLGHAGIVLEDENLFDEAECLLDTLKNHWDHPLGGFWEGEIADPVFRRQNPHMHLLEAFCILYEGSGRKRFADAANGIAALCRSCFLDMTSGALLEYFNEDWTPVSGQIGQISEPGHCFEWAWLFEGMATCREDAIFLSDTLTNFGRRHGIDEKRGVAINEVLTNGQIINGNARLWPQTERLKIAVARYRRTDSLEELKEIIVAWQGLYRYLRPMESGLWYDKMKEDGKFIKEMVPGSTLYHIACAIKEMCSIDDFCLESCS